MAINIVQWFRPHLLGRFKKEVERALHGDMTMQDLLFLTRTKALHGITVLNDCEPIGFALYNVVEVGRKRRLRVVVLVGRELDAWLPDLIDYLRMECRNLGLDGIEACGRKGFARKLKGRVQFKEFSYIVVEEPWDLELEEL